MYGDSIAKALSGLITAAIIGIITSIIFALIIIIGFFKGNEIKTKSKLQPVTIVKTIEINGTIECDTTYIYKLK